MTVMKTVDSYEMAEELRLLRNACAEWMTGSTEEISASQQRAFFSEKIATGAVDAFLVYSNAVPVAYGILLWGPDGRAWSSTGVSPAARGRGLGTLVTVENVKRAHRRGVPMWAEVRHDNTGQQKICAGIGYEILETFERDGMVIDLMRCDELASGL